MFSAEDLEKKKRPELQALCKENQLKATGKNAELKTALLSLEREENDDEQVIVKVAARNAGKTPKRKQTFPPVWPRMHTDPKGLKMLLQEVSKDSFGSDVNQHSFRSVKNISGEELEISTACCDYKYKKWKHKDGRDCNAVKNDLYAMHIFAPWMPALLRLSEVSS